MPDTQIPITEVRHTGVVKKLLFLSTISTNKGIYETIEIFRVLSRDYSDLRFIVAGDGPELARINNSIPSNLKDKITFTGYVTRIEKKNIFRKSYLYLFPSHYEGMPISLLEAMGYGLPVVCSNVGAIPDFFENGNMGFMINSRNSREFLNFIKR